MNLDLAQQISRGQQPCQSIEKKTNPWTRDSKTTTQSIGGLASPLIGEGQAADQRALQVYFAPIDIGYRAGHPSPCLTCLTCLLHARTPSRCPGLLPARNAATPASTRNDDDANRRALAAPREANLREGEARPPRSWALLLGGWRGPPMRRPCLLLIIATHGGSALGWGVKASQQHQAHPRWGDITSHEM